MTSQQNDTEQLITKFVLWMWRNMLASGVFIGLSWYGYIYFSSEFKKLEARFEEVKENLDRQASTIDDIYKDIEIEKEVARIEKRLKDNLVIAKPEKIEQLKTLKLEQNAIKGRLNNFHEQINVQQRIKY